MDIRDVGSGPGLAVVSLFSSQRIDNDSRQIMIMLVLFATSAKNFNPPTVLWHRQYYPHCPKKWSKPSKLSNLLKVAGQKVCQVKVQQAFRVEPRLKSLLYIAHPKSLTKMQTFMKSHCSLCLHPFKKDSGFKLNLTLHIQHSNICGYTYIHTYPAPHSKYTWDTKKRFMENRIKRRCVFAMNLWRALMHKHTYTHLAQNAVYRF